MLLLSLSLLLSSCLGQQVGQMKRNEQLPLTLQECKGTLSCQPKSTRVTMDHNWRWLHVVGQSQNCYSGNLWDDALCPDPQTCTENCCIDGIDAADWTGTYGVKSTGTELSLQFVTKGPYSTNIGSRVFLMDPNGQDYYMFKLLNREFTFDTDVSNLPCGLNGALYFVEMDKDGGKSRHPGNEAGAEYGTGYCDAQCPHDLKFINGEANSIDWIPSDNDQNSGFGHYGSCCAELDIWEGNSVANAFTPHPCDIVGPLRCEGKECGDNKSGDRYEGVCDKDGCDFHNWRLGDKTFFGPGSQFKVDSTKPVTVVTQFLTDDGTDTGNFVEMRRLYVQGGKVISNSVSNVDGVETADSVTDKMCDETKAAFGDINDFKEKGGLKKMGEAMGRGMVLVLSLWDDHEANMLWLDGDYPLDKDPNEPGVSRGPCARDSGDPADLEANQPNSSVKFSNLRFGTLGSTFEGGSSPTTTTDATTAGSTCPGGSLEHCVSLCPVQPAQIHDACVQECNDLC